MASGDLVTLPGHIQFGELLLGPATPYRWQTLTGWEDSPGLDSGTVNRSSAHGAFPGRLLAQPRTITVDGLVVRAEPGALGTVVRHLATATALGDDEVPLVVMLDDSEPLLSWARCIRRSIPVGRGGYALGIAAGGALQFEATDPRRYSLTEQRVETRLPMPETGLDWHLDPGPERLDWPLAFGAPGSTGSLVAVNEGDTAAHPIIMFRGPVDRPSLANLATGDVIEYDLTLAADDELLVDTAAGTVTLNGTASRLYTVSARSVPEETFTLLPGTTNYAFRAAPGSTDPRAACSVRWRSAFW
ncbi:phage distal tail protein [Streptomyces sp. NPDC059008]|uniref:phage distal tail protein n=1 Tax=Streptomyces sp. NPDC059008 TaxID=3346693 RepID=UPI00369BF1F0